MTTPIEVPDKTGERTTNPSLIELRCIACDRRYAADTREGPCECDQSGTLEVRYDLERVKRSCTRTPPRADILRYRALLPLRGVDPVLVPNVTPIRTAPRLARGLELRRLLVKDETGQPTGSLKDRASAVVVARADALGYRTIACASSGNAAVATAAMAAAQGLDARLYLPANAPAAKLLQAEIYGAQLVSVSDGYEAAYALCNADAARNGWYNRNSGHTPYAVEGKKTCGLEIAEQTAADPLEWIAVATGDGCTLAGIWKGISEMATILSLPRRPRILAVQSASIAPLHDAWAAGLTRVPAPAPRHPPETTVADAIAVGQPHSGDRALQAVRDSSGAIVAVDDAAILTCIARLAHEAGIFAEPAAAATLAGLQAAREQGIIEPGESVLLIASGAGLKSVDVIRQRRAAILELVAAE